MAKSYKLVEETKRTTAECAEKWNADKRDVSAWCRADLISGAVKETSFPFRWIIPCDAKRPIDACIIRELLWQIIELENGRISEIDVSAWGIPAVDVAGCIQSLKNADYLAFSQEGAGLQVTKRGLALIGRGQHSEALKETPTALKWTADAVGIMAGSAIDTFIQR